MKESIMLAFLACLLGAALSKEATPNLMPISIKPGTAKYYDSDGRQRLFRGLNAVMKISPYLPPSDQFDPMMSFSAEDAAYLQSWGMNIIRLGYMWTGVETANGTFNQTYLNDFLNIVNIAAEGGIYTLVDAHQDLFSERFCADGAPVWATTPFKQNFPEPLAPAYVVDPETGFPSWEDCAKFAWSEYYFTEEVAGAFQALYDNKYGLASSYASFWEAAATLLKGNTNVIGFELINEPFAGDIFNDPFLMEPGQADFKNLQPFYDFIVPSIYNVDPDRLIFFEPITWSSLMKEGPLAVGFTHVPGGSQYNQTSVFAWHYYDPPNFSLTPKGYFERRVAEVANLSSGGMLTEFYATFDPSDVEIMDICDELQVSWISWIYKPFTPASPNSTYCDTYFICPNGTLNYESIRYVSRTYAQAVAGDIVSMSFNETNADFSLIFTPNKSCKLPTEIYLNEVLYYPSGFTVSIFPPRAATWSKAGPNFINVVATNFLTNIIVTITRV